jgi:lon-related putative ATP-dependent protease
MSDFTSHPCRLPPERLFTPCPLAQLEFTTTDELPDLAEEFAHPRAVEALRFGLDVRRSGYNLFVLGEPGSGRHALVRRLLETEFRHQEQGGPAMDWCYIHNFQEATRPRLLKVPAGRGSKLREDMQAFVAGLASALTVAFENEDYRRRLNALEDESKKREDQALRTLGREAMTQGVALLSTEDGYTFVPAKNENETMSEEEYDALPKERQDALEKIIEGYEPRLRDIVLQFPRWNRELQTKVKDLSREALRRAVGHEIEELKPAYADLPEVTAFLDAVLHDVVETGDNLRESQKSDGEMETLLFSGSISLQRYLVNVLVDNNGTTGRPVVRESLPTFQNLMGRVEHTAHMGMWVSNFTLIRAGALHRANGGALVLDAGKLLTQPYAWEGLKRALQSGRLRLESPEDLFGLQSTQQLEPEPMPLDVKVVLVGDRSTYYLLSEMDPEFGALFKVAADLENDVAREPENAALYARLLATLARRDRLKALTRNAVAWAIERAARLAEDSRKLTTRTRLLADLLREADWMAEKAGAAHIEPEHLAAALAAQIRRADRVKEKQQEAILNDELMIATDGCEIGQINGLAAIDMGQLSFAHPMRVTAAVRMGDGDVMDIERETELGGPLHSKGMLILSGFLSNRFGRVVPLSVNASLVFEQSYGEVDGDSASLAELCVLQSAIGLLPLRQSLAMTGSVNQLGKVQPIGAVNEKIEGFFDVCQARGLNGEQGVIIPQANVPHLMLRADVVEAVRQGRFHIFAVTHVDQAMELLTGVSAGTPDAKGEVAEDSVNGRIMAQLLELAQQRHGPAEKPKAPRKSKAKEAAPAHPAKEPVQDVSGRPEAGEGGNAA